MATNVKSLAIVLAVLFAPVCAAYADEYQALFDGKSLAGWEGNTKFWSAKDGTITGQTTRENPTPANTFLIWRGGEVKDFELHVKFKIVGGNSGIQYRSVDKGNHVVNGYQADIDSGDTYIGILYEEGGRGILAQRGEKVEIAADGKKTVTGKTGESKEIAAAVKKEDWNDYVVIAKGNQLTQKINGLTTVEVIDNESNKAKSTGILALQLHAGQPMTVQFKDIMYKVLK
jgi:3-keto-disaccharide hydrolase